MASVEHSRLQEAHGKLGALIGIATDVNGRLNQTVDPPSCDVGLDRSAHALKFLEESHASQTPLRVIGIYGRAGIGKTVLLDVIWKKAAFTAPFHARAFVQVGDKPTSEVITRLQSGICWQLSNQLLEFPKPAFGQGELSRLFRKLQLESKPIFLAIDNIFEAEHLMDLLSLSLKIDDMPRASCIAVTCREHRIVETILKMCHLGAGNSSQVCIFEPKCLTFEESKRVFADSARVQHSDSAHQDLLDAMVPLCGGMPLALKVLGSVFVDEEKRKPEKWRGIESHWASFSDQDNTYTSQVTKVLGLSYETLKPSLKEAFLDVVTSFYGWDWDVVETIFDEEVLTDLRESSLIWKVRDINQCNQGALSDGWMDSSIKFYDSSDCSGRVSMHDLILRFGKGITDKPGYVELPLTDLHDLPEPISLRNLILRIDDEKSSPQLVQRLLSYLQEASGLQTLIVQKILSWRPSIMEKAIYGPPVIKYRLAASGGKQQNLRYLSLYGGWAHGWTDFLEKKVLWEIGWMRLQSCDIVELLPDTSMPRLQTLHALNCYQLKHLPVSCVKEWPRLQHFTFRSCSIASIPAEIVDLPLSKTLEIIDCMNLTELPADIGKLRSLKVLRLSGFTSLKKLPVSVGSMQSLETLELSCENLVELSTGIGKLRSLKELCLSHCGSLKKLPKSIGSMESLMTLRMSSCYKLVELPAGIGRLRCLKELCLSYCERLKKLPESVDSMKSLVTLRVMYCNNLVKLPAGMGKLCSLKELSLSHCKGLRKLPESVGSMKSLATLEMVCCDNLVELPAGIGKLPSLKKLVLSNSRSLKELAGCVGSMEYVETIKVLGGNFVDLPAGKLPSLKRLEFLNCGRLKKLPDSVDSMESLETLEVCWCHNLEALPEGIGKLGSLKRLWLSHCRSLNKLLESVGSLASLQTLEIILCKTLVELPASIGNLRSLRALRLCGCTSLKKLPESVGSLESLETLDLTCCTSLEELPELLGNLTSLQHLNLTDCSNLQKLPEFPSNRSVRIEHKISGEEDIFLYLSVGSLPLHMHN